MSLGWCFPQSLALPGGSTVWGRNDKAFEDQKRQKRIFRITTLMLTKRKRKVKTQPVKKPRLASGQNGEFK